MFVPAMLLPALPATARPAPWGAPADSPAPSEGTLVGTPDPPAFLSPFSALAVKDSMLLPPRAAHVPGRCLDLDPHGVGGHCYECLLLLSRRCSDPSPPSPPVREHGRSRSLPRGGAAARCARQVSFADSVQTWETYGREEYPRGSHLPDLPENFPAADFGAEDEEGEETDAEEDEEGPEVPGAPPPRRDSMAWLPAWACDAEGDVGKLPDLRSFWAAPVAAAVRAPSA
ncbi:hypothetical protein DFJ74DRAFT_399780 [Hyaloraphidium curvatum]|nr:hypothetical protein DFJ74DRAFT_399780 [Hyaloraphidium curvatum]